MHLMRLPMPLLGVDVDLVVWRGTEGQAPEHLPRYRYRQTVVWEELTGNAPGKRVAHLT